VARTFRGGKSIDGTLAERDAVECVVVRCLVDKDILKVNRTHLEIPFLKLMDTAQDHKFDI
jgi:hypothetical protein